jgi:SAM-dependent methyltransferase
MSKAGVSGPGYVFGQNADDPERERLRHFEAWGDRYTVPRLHAIGVRRGWKCLEVGAGSGSVARMLSDRVGSEGTVLATDINLRFLTDLPSNVEVQQHDVTSSNFEPRAYDLVHCRALLMHLTDPGSALARMVSAARPGGWLLLEEAEWGLCVIGGHADASWATGYLHELFRQHEQAALRHPYFGRNLLQMAAAAGLENLDGDVAAPLAREPDSSLEVIRLTVRALRCASLDVGASVHDLDRLDAVLAHPDIAALGLASVGVWGRRPA